MQGFYIGNSPYMFLKRWLAWWKCANDKEYGADRQPPQMQSWRVRHKPRINLSVINGGGQTHESSNTGKPDLTLL